MNRVNLVRILISFILFFMLTAYADVTSPVGFWRTIDDHTQQPAGVMQIWQVQGKLYGRIVEIFPTNGNKPTDICQHCPQPFYNKPILGMAVMWNFVPKNNGWGDGKIMDPRNGKIYSCQMQLTNNGMKLNVHGYIGISLLGRTQTWDRLPKYKLNINQAAREG